MTLARIVRTGMFVALAAVCWAQTADELIAKNLAARGGAEKLRAIETIRMTGTISFGDAVSPITVDMRRPGQIREEFQTQGTRVVRAFDGATGWELQKNADKSQVRELAGGELDNIREEAENAIGGALLDYAKKGSRVEALGKDTFDGKPVYRLRITTHMGTGITQYLDAATYIDIHEEIERSANGKLLTITETVGDYREVNGIKFAYLFVSGTKENPAATKLQVEKMELGVPIEASEFAMPK
jgi:hypothetical protein